MGDAVHCSNSKRTLQSLRCLQITLGGGGGAGIAGGHKGGELMAAQNKNQVAFAPQCVGRYSTGHVTATVHMATAATLTSARLAARCLPTATWARLRRRPLLWWRQRRTHCLRSPWHSSCLLRRQQRVLHSEVNDNKASRCQSDSVIAYADSPAYVHQQPSYSDILACSPSASPLYAEFHCKRIARTGHGHCSRGRRRRYRSTVQSRCRPLLVTKSDAMVMRQILALNARMRASLNGCGPLQH